MPDRGVRGLLLGVVLGSVAVAGGCGGGPDEGELVQVNEEAEAKVTKAMEEYYMKKHAPGKVQGR